jgi:hypothetical protein
MELHDTIMGRRLIEHHIPEIHRQLERIATALEKANTLKEMEIKEQAMKDLSEISKRKTDTGPF